MLACWGSRVRPSPWLVFESVSWPACAWRRVHGAVPPRGRVILKPLGKRACRGQRAVARLRGSLKHLKRSTDELMALTRSED